MLIVVPEELADATSDDAGSRAALVISKVKRMIATGELKAGDRLPIEKVLAANWGVSRGSLREGVRALAALGVLETRQGDGTYVTQLDPMTLLSPLGFYSELRETAQSADLLAVRRVLETESAGLAAIRMSDVEVERLADILSSIDGVLASDEVDPESFIDADAEFHRSIAAASGNPALAALIEALVSRTLRARLWRAITERDSLGEAHAEHRDILVALRAHDPERARIRMASHLLGVEEYATAHPRAVPELGEPPEQTFA
jgi:GntR family transcriptional regulator, transcriptional repressor for pyruvate dehydrogenase complex